MITKAPFLSNSDEMEKAETLGLDKIPDAELTPLTIGFNMDDVKMYHYTSDNQIALYIGGFRSHNQWKVERNAAMIRALEAKFNNDAT